MNAFISFLTSSPEVSVFAGLILVTAALSFGFWYRPALRDVTAGVHRINAALMQEPHEWAVLDERVRPVLKIYPNLASSWIETEERVITLTVSGESKPVMFGSPRDLWNPSALLSRRLNLGLAEAVPNILVGVGLFFTFVFLSWALVDTTAALTQVGSSAKDTERAISELLEVAVGKFLTSLAGLLASIVWTYKSKKALNGLNKACDQLLEAISKVVTANGAELLMRQQLEAAADTLGLSEELLNESREQTGTFKRFETDLAITLAGAITKSFSPQMEAMTTKLVAAIDGLSEKLGTMNQEALQTMLQDFAVMLKQATDSEMAQLRQTLSELAGKLEGAGIKLGEGANGAATAINEAGAQLVARVQEISQNLATGATNLESAAGSIKLAMNDLEVTMLEASNIGKRGALFVNETLEKTGQTLQSLDSISGGLADAASALQSVSGSINEVVNNVEELSREQRAVVSAVRDVAPNAQAAVERVAAVLEVAGRQSKESIEATAATLTRTVASITEGVSSYTDQVADLHRRMDGNLAKAVGSFDKGVNELAESVEELGEIMQKSKRT
jgi:ABC-type transporter Mla subunit MlaD